MNYEPSKLPELARRINVEHAACVESARDAIARAVDVGRLLIEAKSQVGHGEWAGWVAENCAFGLRQAQNYMRVYRNREAIEGQMRSGDSPLTSLRRAVEILTYPREDQPMSRQVCQSLELPDWRTLEPMTDELRAVFLGLERENAILVHNAAKAVIEAGEVLAIARKLSPDVWQGTVDAACNGRHDIAEFLVRTWKNREGIDAVDVYLSFRSLLPIHRADSPAP